MKLIVGLGNPGREYKKTRHNIGFMVVDNVAKKIGVNINNKKNSSLYTLVTVKGEKVILLKPQKFINLSGDVIFEFVKFFKISIDDILIISDDLDLPVGSYKLKGRGSSGGHNGLKNIEQNLNTNEYKRLKIGISNNKDIDTRNYVLSSFSNEEKILIDKIIDTTTEIVIDFLQMDFLNLMNKYNGR